MVIMPAQKHTLSGRQFALTLHIIWYAVVSSRCWPTLPWCSPEDLRFLHVQVVLTEPPKSNPIEVVVDLDAKSVTSFKKVCMMSLHHPWS